jgi:hypothetical protein
MRRAGFISLLLVMMSGMYVVTAGPAVAACSWAIVKSPNPNPPATNILSGVVTVSRASAWAVGYTVSPSYRPLVAHFTSAGDGWTKVQSPDPSNGGGLHAVAGVDTDLWAVGEPFPAHVGHPFAMHWSGTAWRLSDVPSLPKGSTLNGVTRVSAADVWAVGGRMSGSGFLVPVTLHRRGQIWSTVSAPNPRAGRPADTEFTAATRVPGTSQVWAVGSFDDTGGGNAHPFAEVWRKGSWTRSPLPPVKGHAVMTGVEALSVKNAWAVGTQYPGNPNPATRTLIFHWDGTSWTRVSSPNPGPEGNILSAVSVSSPKDAWAVGDFGPTTGDSRTLVLHWGGTAWAKAGSPNPTGSNPSLSGVSVASGSDRVWAVGQFNTKSSVLHALIERGC